MVCVVAGSLTSLWCCASDQVEIDGAGYVVTGVTVHMKLHNGKYKRHHSRLDVQPTGRYFLNVSPLPLSCL